MASTGTLPAPDDSGPAADSPAPDPAVPLAVIRQAVASVMDSHRHLAWEPALAHGDGSPVTSDLCAGPDGSGHHAQWQAHRETHIQFWRRLPPDKALTPGVLLAALDRLPDPCPGDVAGTALLGAMRQRGWPAYTCRRLLEKMDAALGAQEPAAGPPAAPDPAPDPGSAYTRRCAYLGCKRGPGGEPATFVPRRAWHAFCSTGCRVGDLRLRRKAGNAQG